MLEERWSIIMLNIMSETNHDGNYQTIIVYTGIILMAITMQLFIDSKTKPGFCHNNKFFQW